MKPTIQETAFRIHGPRVQLGQLQEECAELIAAVNHLNRGRVEPGKVLEEMVDVEIMLDQFRSWFGADEWTKKKNEKLVRLEERVK